MKSIGFLKSHKAQEKRIALLPEDLSSIQNCNQLYFETGYGIHLGYSDEEYMKYGAHIVSREDVFDCDIITDVKLGDADYLDQLQDNKILFGWAHAVQGVDFTTKVLTQRHTVIAWEELYDGGRYIFYRNREIAGEAAVLQAFLYCGKMPYDTKIAIIGNGQTAKGALRILHGLGADVDVYPRKLENLFRKKMYDYDVLINCVLWDTTRTDRLIYREDLKKLKKGAMIIDVSCDPQLEIETSRPTTIANPVYVEEGIIHYAVDNTPAIFSGTVSQVLSKGISKYIDSLVQDDFPDIIKNAIVINNGHIVDTRISEFRQKRGLFCQ